MRERTGRERELVNVVTGRQGLDAAGSAAAPLAVLVKRFPRLSETFVLNEFLELRRQGLPVRLYAVMDPSQTAVQPEAAALRHEVGYLRPGSWLAMVPGMTGAAWRHRIALPAVARLLPSRRSLPTLRHCGEALVLVESLTASGRSTCMPTLPTGRPQWLIWPT